MADFDFGSFITKFLGKQEGKADEGAMGGEVFEDPSVIDFEGGIKIVEFVCSDSGDE